MSNERKLIDVGPETHERLKREADKRGQPLKRLGNMLLDYALGRLEAGELRVVEKVESGNAPD